MSAQAVGRAASAAGKAANKSVNEHVLNKGAKRDPELYVSSSCLIVTTTSALYLYSFHSIYLWHGYLYYHLTGTSRSHVRCFWSCRFLLRYQPYFYHSLLPWYATNHLQSTGRKPTSVTSESKVNIAPGSMPWEADSSKGGDSRDHFKYKYHPGGDPKNPPKDAPSALHSVIIPNVNLPKVGKIFLLLSNCDNSNHLYNGRWK
jgi:hypothetical protein